MNYVYSIFSFPPKTTKSLTFTAKITRIVHGNPIMIIFQYDQKPYFYHTDLPDNIMVNDTVEVIYENTDEIISIKNLNFK